MSIQYDMTKGPMAGQMFRFAFPLMLTYVLQTGYGAADMLIVSRFAGEEGVAAVSNGSTLAFLIASFCMGFGSGGAVLIGSCAACGDKTAQQRAIAVLCGLTVLLSAAVTAVGLAFSESAVSLLGVPAAIHAATLEYTRILCAGTVFVFGLHTVCAVLRALGNAVLPLLLVFFSAIFNIVLDLVFVGLLGRSTTGAAEATVLAQAGAFVVSLLLLKTGKLLPTCSAPLSHLKEVAIAMLRTGMPVSAQTTVINVSFLIMTAMLNDYGTAVAAATGIGLKINTLAGMPCWGIGQAVTVMTAQNLAVGNTERVRNIVRTALKLNVAVTTAFVLPVQAAAEPIMSFFLTSASSAADIGVQYLRWCCSLNSLFYITMYVFDSFAIGTGHSAFAFFNAVLDALLVRLLLSFLLAETFGMGYAGWYVGQALSPLFPALCGSVFYLKGAWQKGSR